MLDVSTSSWSSSNKGVKILTPSIWSANIMKDFGGTNERNIKVWPNGFNEFYFHPAETNDECVDFYKLLDVPKGKFLFLHVSSATNNKNIPLLLNAYRSVLAEHFEQVILLIKSLGDLYPDGQQNIANAIHGKGFTDDDLIWINDPLPYSTMGLIFRCVQAYVSPYMNEGFNMPALESMASGVPVIVSSGGPTDEFTTAQFARYINTTIKETGHSKLKKKKSNQRFSENAKRNLIVDEESLAAEMRFVVHDYFENNGKWANEAKSAAIEAAKKYAWSALVVDLLSDVVKEEYSTTKYADDALDMNCARNKFRDLIGL